MAEEPRVLIVEDDKSTSRLMVTFISRMGYQIKVAEDGMEAMSILREWQPQLILADVMMPRLDGYRLCRMVKFDQRWKSIPLIHVTAKGGQDALSKSREVGADDLLRKPFNIQELQSILARYAPSTKIASSPNVETGSPATSETS